MLTEIRVPQLGEGLREALIVSLLKKPGDAVARDEKIYALETDKATVEVESPVAGRLAEWFVREGDVVPIGAVIAHIAPLEVEGNGERRGVSPPVQAGREAAPDSSGGEIQILIPPRTRAYCRKRGLGEEEIARIPARGRKLMPEDVDEYLAAPGGSRLPAHQPAPLPEAPYTERPLPARQRVFVYRARRSAERVLPATVTRPLDWSRFQQHLEALRRQHLGVAFSESDVLAFAVARTAATHSRFRSQMVEDDAVREYRHVNLGIAVQRPGDELVTAVIPEADTLDFSAFLDRARSRIAAARDGEDQAIDAVQLLVSSMLGLGLTDAVPLLVAPAIAVLFIGEPYALAESRLAANLTLTFDHRLINGHGAALFLQSLAELAEGGGQAKSGPDTAAATLKDRLLAAPPRERWAVLDLYLRQVVGRLLNLPAEEVATDTPVITLGIDSLKSVTLAEQVEAALGLGVSASLAWNHPTVRLMVEHLLSRTEGRAPSRSPDSSAPPSAVAVDQRERELTEQLEQLSEEEAAALLAHYREGA
jgi:pyruvate dehydrogenase E2 component (dihydrolipoamide acetyltransferase)